MTLKFKSTYLSAIRERYFKASKKEKSIILDELCQVTGYNRKHTIRVLAKGHKTGRKNSGRKRQYSDLSINHLKKLWHIMGRICSKKMVSALPVWIKYYEDLDHNEAIKEELLSISHSTIDRYLKSYKVQFARRKRTGTIRSKRYSSVIPIKDFTTKNFKPGHLQADTVAHCGITLKGQYAWTLTVTDEFSGWTVNRACMGKDSASIIAATMNSFMHFPIKIHSLNTDSGTEFINEKLKDFLDRRKIEFTRSRPYRKNDNCYVEQKNFTHVREVFGYERIAKDELVWVMNEIYKTVFNDLKNFFIPQLKSKSVVRAGSKYIRKHDKAKTPYQRLMESEHVSRYEKDRLQSQFNSLNPIKLRKELNFHLKRFHRILEGKSCYRYSMAS